MNNDLFGQPETAPNRGIPNTIPIFFLRLSIREASLAAFTVTGEQEGNQTMPFSKKTRSQAPSSLFSRDNAKKNSCLSELQDEIFSWAATLGSFRWTT